MNHILITLAAVLLLGCDPHMDSIYLGRAEGNMIADVSAGNIAAVKEYLDKGGNVNLQDEPGNNPLHWAVIEDRKGSHREMVKLLIDRGADVKAKTRHTGEAKLYSAARNAAQGHPKSHQMYLDLG